MFDDVIVDAMIDAKKAHAILNAAINSFNLDEPELGEFDKKYIISHINVLYALLSSVSDYIGEVEKKLEVC